MKKIQWKKVIISDLLILFITLWLFFPIDILIYGNKITNNISRYFLFNLFALSILIAIYTLIVFSFNNKFWMKRVILRIILEILFTFLTINILLFISEKLNSIQISLKDYILITINNKIFFLSCLTGGFIILIIETIYLYNKRKDSEIENEKFRYTQLKNQLNPHFLFNSLSVSISLIKKDQDKAVEFMKKLSLVYRYVLINTDSDFVRLEEEINFIKKYIDILQIRYDEGLNVTYNIDDKILYMKIVPLSLQLLVENAVKHNAIYSYNPLNIHIYSEGEQIVVANNIIKKALVIDSIGIGLKNLNQKYNILCSKDIEIINDSKNFIVKIPLK